MTITTRDEKGKEQAMFRQTLFAALAALGLTTWVATESFAQTRLQPSLRPQGLVVTQVIPGTTAALQRIEVGDVIVSVGGDPVRSAADLHYRLGRAGRVAELGVIDWRTGWQSPVTVYPRLGRIGVDVQPASVGGVRPVPPVYPPWDWNVRPTPLPRPVNPWDGGVSPLPLPGPGVLPGR
jgi:hypothetical protein